MHEWMAVAIAIIALVVSLISFILEQKLQKNISRSEARILLEQIKTSRDAEVRAWVNATIAEMADFHATMRGLDATTDVTILTTKHWGKISGLWDAGRMYFPNEIYDDFGANKPYAYQGYRQPILDLFEEYLACVDQVTPGDKSDLRQLIDLRRLFVSEAQFAIDPRRQFLLEEINERKEDKGQRAFIPEKTS